MCLISCYNNPDNSRTTSFCINRNNTCVFLLHLQKITCFSYVDQNVVLHVYVPFLKLSVTCMSTCYKPYIKLKILILILQTGAWVDDVKRCNQGPVNSSCTHARSCNGFKLISCLLKLPFTSWQNLWDREFVESKICWNRARASTA